MKGNDKIIASLNKLLAGELGARDQYFTHAEMYRDWGLNELYERTHHEMQEETEHAARLIQRILFLEGTPDLGKPDPLNIGKDVPAMLKNDLDLEYQVVGALREAIALCETEQDYQTREMLEVLLEDTEEDHAYWLEQQLGLLDRIGVENYLQSKL
jgi:bacterioferritin